MQHVQPCLGLSCCMCIPGLSSASKRLDRRVSTGCSEMLAYAGSATPTCDVEPDQLLPGLFCRYRCAFEHTAAYQACAAWSQGRPCQLQLGEVEDRQSCGML